MVSPAPFLALAVLGTFLLSSPSFAAPKPKAKTAKKPAIPACEPQGPEGWDQTLKMVSNKVEVKLHREFSTAQIQKMSGFNRGSSWSNPGLTIGKSQASYDFKVAGQGRSDRPGFCVWVTELTVEFSYTDMDVYVSSGYKEGTCEYDEILKHENEHVAIYHRTFEKYRALLEKSLKGNPNLPVKSKPRSYASAAAASKEVGRVLDGIINPLRKRFEAELRAENRKIDTTANYMAIHKRCENW